MMPEGIAGATLLTVHHLFGAALVLERVHILAEHLLLVMKALSDAAMVNDLHLPEVSHHVVVVQIPTVHPHAAWIRIDQLMGLDRMMITQEAFQLYLL